MMSKAKLPEAMSFEEAFQELQQLVQALEAGDLPLEDSLRLFERGQGLASRCSELLEGAELRLRQLVPDEAGGFQEIDLQDGEG